MAINPTGTDLTISVMGVPYYSGRGITQTLAAIDQAAVLERTVNYDLKNLAPTLAQKYKTTITCTDTNPPAIDGIFPGQVVVIECIAELSYLSGGSPNRPVVSGSQRTEGLHTKYRPSLTMMITNVSVSKDEFGAVTAWEIDAEEE